jgi:predicted RNase H-like nuclease (RuvC/YqgF family)
MTITNKQVQQQILDNPLAYIDLPENLKNNKHLALLAIQTNTTNIQASADRATQNISELKSSKKSLEGKLEELLSPLNKWTSTQQQVEELELEISDLNTNIQKSTLLHSEILNSTRIFHHLGDQLNNNPGFIKVLLDQKLASIAMPTSIRILDAIGYDINDVDFETILNDLIENNNQITQITGFNSSLHETYDQALETDKAERLALRASQFKGKSQE